MNTLSPRHTDDHGSSSPLWAVAQMVALVATALLVIGLLHAPKIALSVLWTIVIPMVPASLLLTPHLWRNVCPLATCNMLANGLLGRRVPSQRMTRVAGTVGIVLLVVLVPARRVLFNTDGTALAATIVVVCIAAIALGAVFEAKAGFCNTLCPVLPVERLYGQRPITHLSNPRCAPCTRCSARGCIDLAPTRSIAHALGAPRRSHRWLSTPYGAFAAAFPGFVLGYFTTADGALASAPGVYLSVLAWMVASYLVITLLVRVFRLSAAQAVVALAALAAGLYYWFVSPSVASAIGFANEGMVLRTGFLALVALWYLRAASGGLRGHGSGGVA